MFTVKSKDTCRYDNISLGEIMLRLDPGDMRIRNARIFNAWAGGGEYNVALGLSKCFGLNTGVITALAENEVGLLIEDFVMQGGVDTSLIKWVKYDGVGREVRNGLNFTEKGFGVRGALGMSDRGHTAASQMKADDINWNYIFGTLGTRWFHTGGIFAALSENSAELVIEAIKTAKKYGTIVSYDLNYRPSLWSSIGGEKKAQQVNNEIVKYVDVLFGNEEDFTACLGFEIEGSDTNFSKLDKGNYKKMLDKVVLKYPNVSVIATTLREVKTATINNWSAICYNDGKIYEAREYENLEIYDRVGGGDSFASGFIYGILDGKDFFDAVNYGTAHGALAMTTPGDTTTAKKKEVLNLAKSVSVRVIR